jgi:peroxiredoxin
MQMLRFALAIACVLTLCGSTDAAEQASPVGRQIAGFALRDYRGAEHKLSDFADSKFVVVAFLGTECPLAKLYSPRLVQLAERFAGDGVAIIGVNSNQQDSISDIAQHARSHGIGFPVLKDVGNAIADQFGAVRTPEVFVLDQQRVVRYWGRIDNQYAVGVQRPQATREDLAAAIEELLAGKEVSQPVTDAPGCFIGRIAKPQANSDVTYTRDVAAILQNRCVECHRPGEIAPFALTSYGEVAGWAETILEVIEDGRMPPWHANPAHGKFVNDARLSDDDKQTIRRWVRAGAPQGDQCDLPAPRTFVDGWRIPEPDQVIYMADKPFNVPAEGEVRYQYFVVDPKFTEDKWIQAAQCLPDNRAVVHHIIVGIQPPGGKRRSTGGELDSEWLTATAPGARPLILAAGTAKRVPAGSKLVFQMHYTPNGTAQSDRSCVGLVFADPKTVRKEVGTWKAATNRFVIPPHAENHRVEAWHTFGEDSLILAMFPHMHLRGKSFRYEAVYPDGSTEILLDVPRYDFNWQNSYEYGEPKFIPAGTRLHCVAHFDNSENNPANPDPTATVKWGDQTWEEMMIGYFDMALADQDLIDRPPQRKLSRTEEFVAAAKEHPPQVDDALTALVAGAIESDEAFDRLGRALQKRVPQLDRMCLATISDGKLRIERAVQSARIAQQASGRGIEVPAARMGLAEFAAKDGPTVINDLSTQSQPDLKLFARGFGSSLHIPVRIGDKQATISFWSREGEAFPPLAVEFLESVAKQMAAER